MYQQQETVNTCDILIGDLTHVPAVNTCDILIGDLTHVPAERELWSLG